MSAQDNIDRLQALIDGTTNEALKIAYLVEKTEWVKILRVAPSAVRKCTKTVQFIYRSNPINLSVTFFENIPVDETILKEVGKLNLKIGDGFKLRTTDDTILTSFDSVDDYHHQLRFAAPSTLPLLSASDWTEENTDLLDIVEKDVDEVELLGFNHKLSDTAEAFLDSFTDLDGTNAAYYFSQYLSKDDIVKMRAKEKLMQPIIKCLYLVNKYDSNESLVDCFIGMLFRELGFFDGMLFPVPQYSLPLQYGNDGNCTAKADFTVIDVLTFCRLVVVEDKNNKSLRVNSFPRMIACAVASAQRNLETSTTRKRKWESVDECDSSDDVNICAMRSNGSNLFFYKVPVSISILGAMKGKRGADAPTQVLKVGGSEGLDFLEKTQREIIVRILDAWRTDIEEKAQRKLSVNMSM